jgi:hypothetical protein
MRTPFERQKLAPHCAILGRISHICRDKPKPLLLFLPSFLLPLQVRRSVCCCHSLFHCRQSQGTFSSLLLFLGRHSEYSKRQRRFSSSLPSVRSTFPLLWESLSFALQSKPTAFNAACCCSFLMPVGRRLCQDRRRRVLSLVGPAPPPSRADSSGCRRRCHCCPSRLVVQTTGPSSSPTSRLSAQSTRTKISNVLCQVHC